MPASRHKTADTNESALLDQSAVAEAAWASSHSLDAGQQESNEVPKPPLLL